MNEHIDQLISGYAAKSLSRSEVNELLIWVNENQNHRLYFKEQLAIVRSFTKEIDTEFDGKKAFEKLFMKENSTHKTKVMLARISVAASVLVLIISGYYFYSNQEHTKIQLVKISTNDNIQSQILPDSTIVTMAANSRLSFPNKFNENERNVELFGKAFFDVTKNPQQPFIITIKQIKIKVLGTSFEVEYDSITNNVSVSVSEGKVAVICTSNNRTKILTANQKATVTQHGEVISFKQLTNTNYLAWKTGILEFKKAPMKEVSIELEKLFKKKIVFEPKEIQDLLLTTKINNQSFDEINTILEYTLNIRMTQENNLIVIHYK